MTIDTHTLLEAFEEIENSFKDLFRRITQLEAEPKLLSSSGGGAPVDATYLVNTANVVLTSEIVVTAAQGRIIYGDGTPTWTTLNVGTQYQILGVNVAGTQPEWQTFDWDNHIITAGGDGVHTHANNPEGGQVDHAVGITNILADQHHNAFIGLEDTANTQVSPAVDDFIELNSTSTALTILSVPGNNRLDFTVNIAGLTHNLLSATHPDTNPATPPGQGSIIVANGSNLWAEVAHPGTAYHFQTTVTDAVWAQNITMADGAWIGQVAGPTITFDNSNNFLEITGCDVSIGTTIADNILTVQEPTAGATSAISLHSQDGDGTDNVLLVVYGVGTPGVIVNRERLLMGYYQTDATFKIQIDANGTGISRPLILETDGNANQLLLNTNGTITLAAYGAGVVQSSAGGVLSSGAVPLTDIASYAEGALIIGGAADWETLAEPVAAGYALVSDGTTFAWDQTPIWTGDHSWISSTSAHPVLELQNTNNDTLSPRLEFFKNTLGSAFDNDDLGLINFYGENSIGGKERYAYILSESLDVTSGATGGGFKFVVVMDTFERSLLELSGYNGVINQGIITFNNDAQDVDFYVEAAGVADALFIRGNDGQITLGALGAGFVRTTAGGVVSSSALIAGDLPAHAATHANGGGDAVDHDTLTNFIGNEHIDHTSITLTAGAGLTGGGTIVANRTFAVGAGSGIVVNANDVALDINSLAAAAIAAGDFVPFWDLTAVATNKKITFANFEGTLAHDSLVAGTIAAHDTSATGAELDLLTDNSIVNTLHRHSELVASDGAPDPALSVDALGNVGVGATGMATVERLVVQGDAASAVVTSIYAGDGDGTDNVFLIVYGVGTPGAIVNRERLLISYQNAATFKIQVDANGTGVARPLILETDGNANQLYLATDGNIGRGVVPSTAFDIGAGALTMAEMGAPGAGAANTIRTYAVDIAGISAFEIVNSTGDTVSLNDDGIITSEEIFETYVDVTTRVTQLAEDVSGLVRSRTLNGPGYHQFATIAAVAGAVITIIAGGAEDVTQRMLYNTIVKEIGAGLSQTAQGELTPGNTVDIYDNGGTNILVLDVGVGGDVTIYRNTTGTYDVFISTSWI